MATPAAIPRSAREDNLQGPPSGTIIGDRKKIDESSAALLETAPDVIVDMIPHSQEDAEGALVCCRCSRAHSLTMPPDSEER